MILCTTYTNVDVCKVLIDVVHTCELLDLLDHDDVRETAHKIYRRIQEIQKKQYIL